MNGYLMEDYHYVIASLRILEDEVTNNYKEDHCELP
jgi:hypothetical protein